jgi:hypothetical protein
MSTINPVWVFQPELLDASFKSYKLLVVRPKIDQDQGSSLRIEDFESIQTL